jgi:hypothetical protein
MKLTNLPVLISIHDVMPHTLARVRGILDELHGHGPQATLLVTPGVNWGDEELAELHRLAGDGHPLAGHGWVHRVDAVRGWRHRLYSAVISRRVAEHLERDEAAIATLIERCHRWFEVNGFEPPELYVPPAWALGPISLGALRALPFRYYETLTGMLDVRTGRRRRLPLVGFEADTACRRTTLGIVNAANVGLAKALRRPLRLSIHPEDLNLRLAGMLRRAIHSDCRPVHVSRYAELF